jgi:tyrosyl-tRNA synthetase
MPLLEGTDGVRKMSKSYGNYIALNDTPKEIFGKIMSVSDVLMFKYYELLTEHNLSEIKKMHPREAKAKLAEEITAKYHGKDAALKAREEFDNIFSNKQNPDVIEECVVETKEFKLADLLVKAGLAPSKNEARRLIEQGGVKIDGEKILEDADITLSKECILQAGKRNFRKIKIK